MRYTYVISCTEYNPTFTIATEAKFSVRQAVNPIKLILFYPAFRM